MLPISSFFPCDLAIRRPLLSCSQTEVDAATQLLSSDHASSRILSALRVSSYASLTSASSEATRAVSSNALGTPPRPPSSSSILRKPSRRLRPRRHLCTAGSHAVNDMAGTLTSEHTPSDVETPLKVRACPRRLGTDYAHGAAGSYSLTDFCGLVRPARTLRVIRTSWALPPAFAWTPTAILGAALHRTLTSRTHLGRAAPVANIIPALPFRLAREHAAARRPVLNPLANQVPAQADGKRYWCPLASFRVDSFVLGGDALSTLLLKGALGGPTFAFSAGAAPLRVRWYSVPPHKLRAILPRQATTTSLTRAHAASTDLVRAMLRLVIALNVGDGPLHKPSPWITT
ncbi:hypothetical protein B0H14DRAFT_3615835 [Mycena olivaceomarginata]|nr:hypothetical protein B0H14DRAFT_3615835 [Mycena olivaceomarginata]